jgi:hypothetical protein
MPRTERVIERPAVGGAVAVAVAMVVLLLVMTG